MNEKELKKLLDKYYNGASTLEEEEELRLFFIGNNVPDGYETEKDIFGYYSQSALVPEPSADFETRIIKGIDEVEERLTLGRNRKILYTVMSAAASLIILIGSYFLIVRTGDPADTFSDPQIAYAETMKILMDVSNKLNKGTLQLKQVNMLDEYTTKSFRSINNSTSIVEEKLKRLDYFQKAYEMTNLDVNK